MNEEAPALRPAVGHPGIDWSGDGALGGATRERTATPTPVPADVRVRAIGFLIDFVLLFGIVVFATMVMVIVAGIDTTASQAEIQRQAEDLYPLLYLVEGVIQFAYNFVWNTIGWSPGKRMLGLRTVDAAGRPPGPRLGLLRTVGSIVSSSLFGLGYVWALWDREHRTWHDRIGRTWVVRVEREEAPSRRR